MEQQAFILRIAPSNIDRVPQALQGNQIIIGWAYAKDLIDPELTWEQFREIIRKEYYSDKSNLRKAGACGVSFVR
jgi:hypothetical protein